MSSGTFSLMPGPPSPGIDQSSFGGTPAVGLLGGAIPVAQLCLDVSQRVKRAPNPIVQLAYMRACRDFCKRTMWLKRNVPNQILTIGAPVYNFGVETTLEVIGVAAAQVQQQNTTWVNLRPADPATFDPNMKNDLPTWYSYIPEGMIQFYPTPNYTYLSNVEVICQTALNGTLVPQDLVNKFNLYIDAGAEAFLYGMDGEPWFNPMLSEKAERYFIEGIGQARTWRDKGNQTGSVRATPRPFLAR